MFCLATKKRRFGHHVSRGGGSRKSVQQYQYQHAVRVSCIGTGTGIPAPAPGTSSKARLLT